MENLSSHDENIENCPFSVEDTVYVGSGSDRVGKVAFVGTTHFASGVWIGINLFLPNGKNNGSVDDTVYFECEPKHGIFARSTNIRLVETENADGQSKQLSDFFGITSESAFYELSSEQASSHMIKPLSTTLMQAPVDSDPIKIGAYTFHLGDQVQISGGRCGILRYFGTTEFASGEWVGIELSAAKGKNDGSVAGKRYFSCKPNYGLFSVANKITPMLVAQNVNGQSRLSQESLLSYTSNMSSVSRSYRSSYSTAQGSQVRGSLTGGRKSVHTANSASDRKEINANVSALQRLIKEKDIHIERLLEERESECSVLAKVTLERERAQKESEDQRAVIYQLNEQLQNMEATLQHLREEYEQTTLKLHEEKKNFEDLQFRMEEENIDKSTLENQTVDDESKIFELEELLMCAREQNERLESEFVKLQSELAALQAAKHVDGEAVSNLQVERISDVLSTHEEKVDNLCHQQADIIKSLTSDYDMKVSELKSELTTSLKKLDESENQRERLTEELQQTASSLTNEIEGLRTQLAEHEAKYEQQLESFEIRVTELNKLLEEEKVRSSELSDQNSSNLYKLEEKVKFSEAQLAEYQNLICQNSQSNNQNQLQTVSQFGDVDAANQTLAEQLKGQELLLASQRSKLDQAALDRQLLDQDISESNEKVKELHSNLAVVRDQLVQSTLKQEDLTRELQEAQTTRDTLAREIATIIGDLSISENHSTEHLTDRIKQLVDELKGQLERSEESRNELDNYCHQLQTEYHELENELKRVNIVLENNNDSQQDIEALKDELEASKKKMETLELHSTDAFAQLETKSNELQSVQFRLDKIIAEHSEMDKTHNNTMALLEAEKSTLLQRIHEAEQKLAKQQQFSSENDFNNNSTPDSTHMEQSHVTTNGQSEESQINFLNSIIVDLHSKNAELESRVRLLLVGRTNSGDADAGPNSISSKPRTKSVQRLWCDNCLLFDSHDTVNCPKGDLLHTEGVSKSHKSLHKIRQPEIVGSNERMYCQNCGVFDSHLTEQCVDDATF